jgi:hypothetical protein
MCICIYICVYEYIHICIYICIYIYIYEQGNMYILPHTLLCPVFPEFPIKLRMYSINCSLSLGVDILFFSLTVNFPFWLTSIIPGKRHSLPVLWLTVFPYETWERGRALTQASLLEVKRWLSFPCLLKLSIFTNTYFCIRENLEKMEPLASLALR